MSSSEALPPVKTHDPRCMTLMSTEHPDVCDCRTLAMIDEDEIRRIVESGHQTNGS